MNVFFIKILNYVSYIFCMVSDSFDIRTNVEISCDEIRITQRNGILVDLCHVGIDLLAKPVDIFLCFINLLNSRNIFVEKTIHGRSKICESRISHSLHFLFSHINGNCRVRKLVKIDISELENIFAVFRFFAILNKNISQLYDLIHKRIEYNYLEYLEDEMGKRDISSQGSRIISGS